MPGLRAMIGRQTCPALQRDALAQGHRSDRLAMKSGAMIRATRSAASAVAGRSSRRRFIAGEGKGDFRMRERQALDGLNRFGSFGTRRFEDFNRAGTAKKRSRTSISVPRAECGLNVFLAAAGELDRMSFGGALGGLAMRMR